MLKFCNYRDLTFLGHPVVEGMETSDHTPEELDRAIDQMKINKAGGLDNIPPSLIKNMPY